MADENNKYEKTKNDCINLLKTNKNLILTGAPGTGKTHLAKEIAAKMIFGGDKKFDELKGAEKEQFKDQCAFVQFHPSYDYTDFVEGLRPTTENNETTGAIAFERRNGVFKEFCERAVKNYNDSQKSVQTLQAEKSLIETIDEFLTNAVDNQTEFSLTNGNKFTISEFYGNKIFVNIPENKTKIIELQRSEICNVLQNVLQQKISLEQVSDIRNIHIGKTPQQQDSYVFVLCKEIQKQKASNSTNIAQNSENELSEQNVTQEQIIDALKKLEGKKLTTEEYEEKIYHYHIEKLENTIVHIHVDDDVKSRTGSPKTDFDLEKDFIIEMIKSISEFKTQDDVRKFNKGTDKLDAVYYLNVFSEIKKVLNLKPFIFIIDEINRGEISKIFGELFFAIDPGYRGEKGKVKTQYQNLIQEGDVFYDGFYVPDNVYVIGTMNDIDRSVEPMDFAMHRRFAWKEILPDDTADGMGLDAESLKCMKKLNEQIEQTEGLGRAYLIGGAYFLKFSNYKNDKDGGYSALWKNHLEPLLKQYLRGQDDEKNKFNALQNAYGPTSDNSNE